MTNRKDSAMGLSLTHRIDTDDDGVEFWLPDGRVITGKLVQSDNRKARMDYSAPADVTIHRSRVADAIRSSGGGPQRQPPLRNVPVIGSCGHAGSGGGVAPGVSRGE